MIFKFVGIYLNKLFYNLLVLFFINCIINVQVLML